MADDPTLAAGSHVTVTATGFAPDDLVGITMHSTPTDLGTRTADAAGTVTYAFTVPSNATPGAHSLVFATTAKSVSFRFTVSGSTSPNLSATGYDMVTPSVFGAAALLLGITLLYALRRRVLYRGRHI
jgi:hypothetical protein